MGWTKIEKVKPHVCDKPYYVDEGVGIGDLVRCDCGQIWECVGSDWGMQWDPYPRGILKWKMQAKGSCNDR